MVRGGARDPGSVSLGYGLCAKIKFGGLAGVRGGGAGRVTCRHQSPKSGNPPPVDRQKRESPNRTHSGHRHKYRASTRVLVLGEEQVQAWATVGPGRAILSPRRKGFVISWGWAWGHQAGAGAVASAPELSESSAGEDGSIVGGGAWAGARQGPGQRIPTPATVALGAGRLVASGAGTVAGPGPHAGRSSPSALRLAPSLTGLRLLLLCRQLAGGAGAGSARHSSRGSLGALGPVVILLAPWTMAAASASLGTRALWDLCLPWVSHRAELESSPGWHESRLLRSQETRGLQVCGCHGCISASVPLQDRETHCPRLASCPAWRPPGEGCSPDAEVPMALALP